MSQDAKTVFRNVIPKLKDWKSTVDVDKRQQQTQQIFDKCDSRFTNKDIEQFRYSNHILETQMLFENTSDEHILSEREIADAGLHQHTDHSEEWNTSRCFGTLQTSGLPHHAQM